MAKSRLRMQAHAESGPDPEASRSQVAALEDEWIKSRLEGNLQVSEGLIDDDYRGATSDGLAQTKADFLLAIGRSAAADTYAEHNQRHVQIIGRVAVSTGLVSVHGPARTHSFRYLRVYRHDNGAWKLIASQSTRVREA